MGRASKQYGGALTYCGCKFYFSSYFLSPLLHIANSVSLEFVAYSKAFSIIMDTHCKRLVITGKANCCLRWARVFGYIIDSFFENEEDVE